MYQTRDTVFHRDIRNTEKRVEKKTTLIGAFFELDIMMKHSHTLSQISITNEKTKKTKCSKIMLIIGGFPNLRHVNALFV